MRIFDEAADDVMATPKTRRKHSKFMDIIVDHRADISPDAEPVDEHDGLMADAEQRDAVPLRPGERRNAIGKDGANRREGSQIPGEVVCCGGVSRARAVAGGLATPAEHADQRVLNFARVAHQADHVISGGSRHRGESFFDKIADMLFHRKQ